MRNLFLFTLMMATSLLADGIVQIDKVQALGETNSSFEELIKTNLKKEKTPYLFQLESKSTSIEFISEIYYLWNKNLPPDIYIATFHPEKKYLLDLVVEKSILELPPEIEIVKTEFQEREEDIFKRALKKYIISLSLNKNKLVLSENITENLQTKKLREILSSRIKTESKEKKSEDAFSYLKEQFDTATRTTQKVEDLPITVSIIGKKEIRDYNYRTLVEALKFKPGIMVSEPGNGETGNHFYQRGLFGNSYSKILLNGMPISPSVSFRNAHQ
jgi:hypothetical protein